MKLLVYLRRVSSGILGISYVWKLLPVPFAYMTHGIGIKLSGHIFFFLELVRTALVLFCFFLRFYF